MAKAVSNFIWDKSKMLTDLVSSRRKTSGKKSESETLRGPGADLMESLCFGR
jgi:hypothetical protein